MAKRKTTTRRTTKSKAKPRAAKAKRPAGPGLVRGWWDSLSEERRHGIARSAGRLFVLAILITLAAFGMIRLKRRVMQMPAYSASVARIQLADRPAWMTDALMGQICDEIVIRQGSDMGTFDGDLAQRVYSAAVLCPWFRQVHDVRILRVPANENDHMHSAGAVLVRPTYRTPTAIVASGEDQYVIDDQGAVLPWEQASHLPLVTRLPRIVGVAEPAPSAGFTWGGADLTAALAMVKLLVDKPYFNEISVVDVTNYNRRGSLTASAITLVAVSGQYVTKIRFGNLPLDGAPAVGEPSVERKFAYLEGWRARNSGQIAGPAYLDLRYPDKIGIPASYAATMRPQ